MPTITNNPKLAGAVAGRKEFFGDFNRYAIFPVHTRFDLVQWFVSDAETPDELGLSSIIRQSYSKTDAVQDL